MSENTARYWHLEYLQLDPKQPEMGLCTYVDTAQTVPELSRKISAVISHPGTFTLHLRLLPQPEKGVHLYDETQALAKAQGEAHQYKTALEGLTKRYWELDAKLIKANSGWDHDVESLDKRLDQRLATIEVLEGRIDSVKSLVHRANERCVYPEPKDILRILSGSVARPDDEPTALERAMAAEEELRQLKDGLKAILPDRPMKDRGTPNECDAAEAEWGVYEQIAELLKVTLPDKNGFYCNESFLRAQIEAAPGRISGHNRTCHRRKGHDGEHSDFPAHKGE